MKIRVIKDKIGKVNTFRCDDNLKIREQLLSDAIKGKITQETMRSEARKIPGFYSERIVFNNPEKFEIII